MAEALSCPFCGADATRMRGGRAAQAECLDCGAEGPLARSAVAALAAWNRRADGWRDPADPPKDSRKVTVFYLNKLGKGRQVMARYYRDGELEWHPDVEWHEEGEFAPAGWYPAGDCERCEDEPIEPLSFTVLRWRPLPPPPGEEGDDG